MVRAVETHLQAIERLTRERAALVRRMDQVRRATGQVPLADVAHLMRLDRILNGN